MLQSFSLVLGFKTEVYRSDSVRVNFPPIKSLYILGTSSLVGIKFYSYDIVKSVGNSFHLSKSLSAAFLTMASDSFLLFHAVLICQYRCCISTLYALSS